jgi:hypothetical protein
MKHFLLIACLAFASTACHSQVKSPASTPQEHAVPGPSFSGKVTETLNTAGYTYLQVDTGTQRIWVAAPAFEVKNGDSVAVANGMPMQNYSSKTLKREFDLVYFTDNVQVNGKPLAAPAVHGELPIGHPPLTGATAAPEINLSSIKKAAGGKTVGEIHSEKEKLKGKQVSVRGKVVRYNARILGKNWLRIQDGTGSPGSAELAITTDAVVKVGDTVLVSGILAADKDFGSNYKYSVIIENAKVVVE